MTLWAVLLSGSRSWIRKLSPNQNTLKKTFYTFIISRHTLYSFMIAIKMLVEIWILLQICKFFFFKSFHSNLTTVIACDWTFCFDFKKNCKNRLDCESYWIFLTMVQNLKKNTLRMKPLPRSVCCILTFDRAINQCFLWQNTPAVQT